MSDQLLPCKTCGYAGTESVRFRVWIDQGLDRRGPHAHCLECNSLYLADSESLEDQVSAWNRRATQPAEQWISCSDRLPEVSEGCQQEFIVCAKRNQSGKLVVMSALYLNAYPLYCDYDNDEADEDGNIPHTGWYDAKSNGDDANCYSEIDDSRYAYGAKVTQWMPLPQPAVRGAEHE